MCPKETTKRINEVIMLLTKSPQGLIFLSRNIIQVFVLCESNLIQWENIIPILKNSQFVYHIAKNVNSFLIYQKKQ